MISLCSQNNVTKIWGARLWMNILKLSFSVDIEVVGSFTGNSSE